MDSPDGPRGMAESLGKFLLRSSAPRMTEARARLESWLEDAPGEFARGVRSRLWGDRDDHSASAFWELYLHRSLRSARLAHELHPAIDLVSSRPDFLVATAGGPVYVEAVTLHEDETTRVNARRADELRRIVESLVPPGYAVTVSIDTVGERGASHLGFRRWFREALASCPSSPETPVRLEAGLERDGWSLRVTAQSWHFVDGTPDPRMRRLGVGGLGHVSLDEGRLIDAIARKALHYGPLPHPLVVAVHLARSITDERAVMRPLYGEAVAEPLWVASRERSGWDRRDLRMPTWGASSRVATRVAGVLFANALLQPWNIGESPLMFCPARGATGAVRALPWPIVGPDDDPTRSTVWARRGSVASRLVGGLEADRM